MIKIYVIWQYNPVVGEEVIIGWNKLKTQAIANNPTWPNPGRIEECTISQEVLDSIRSCRLIAVDEMINNIPQVIKKSKLDDKKALLIRYELLNKKKLAERMASARDGYIFDEEIEFYLSALEAGVL